MNFEEAFEILIDDEHEGSAYVNDPKDPGGETKFGISKRAYPLNDIKNMNKETAKAIYKLHYWDVMRLDDKRMPPWLKQAMFDFAVNSGVSRSVKIFQGILNDTSTSGFRINIDGQIGDETLNLYATLACEANQEGAVTFFVFQVKIFQWFLSEVIKYYCSLPSFSTYGKGWMRRVAANMMAGY